MAAGGVLRGRGHVRAARGDEGVDGGGGHEAPAAEDDARELPAVQELIEALAGDAAMR